MTIRRTIAIHYHHIPPNAADRPTDGERCAIVGQLKSLETSYHTRDA